MSEEVNRARQLFSFLKAFAEQRLPKQRTISQQLWSLALLDLPDHPSIIRGEVVDASASDDTVAADGAGLPLLTVKRPKLTTPPRPPAAIRDYVKAGWDLPTGSIAVHPTRNIERPEGTITEHFEDDPERVEALADWELAWNAWALAEQPTRKAMDVYSRLFELRGRMALESERVELVVGDGRLRWQHPNGLIDHPVLLQRVELQFDTAKNEFTVVDADRPPELYNTVIESEHLTQEQHHALRTALEEGGFHPLAGEPTPRFLRQVVGSLAPRGEFSDKWPLLPATVDPVIGRDPYLILRTRPPGFADAFRKIIDDLENRDSLPRSLTRVLGVDTSEIQEVSTADTSPWGEPADVLLSKPANAEQVKIARTLDRNHAVLVQGPPGTGKSHTIANLIGHLVAQGKRVLVTSHTTKALKVLRDHLDESLRPLCVSVLDNDSEGRSQLEGSIHGILTRLTNSSDDALGAEVADIALHRLSLNQNIETIVKDLYTVRLAEYEPILFGGQSVEPAEAAAWVREHTTGNDWIPGLIEKGAPLPLGTEELAQLYQTSAGITLDEEGEIDGGLPDLGMLLEAEPFAGACSDAKFVEPAQFANFWELPPDEQQLRSLEELDDIVRKTVGELDRLTPWQREIVATGHGGGSGPDLWETLGRMIEDGRERWEHSRPILLEHAIDKAPDGETGVQRKVAEELRTHLQGGGALGFGTLLFKGAWKSFLATAKVNGVSPTTAEACNALVVHYGLVEGRSRIETRWDRLAVPAGLPRFSDLSATPEPRLDEYAAQFEPLLTWWSSRWPGIEKMAQSLGLRWEAYRAAAVAAQASQNPFEGDAALLREGVQSLIGARTAAVRAVAGRRQLTENHARLVGLKGPIGSALESAAVAGDPLAYRAALDALRAIHAKLPLLEHRRAMLKTLALSAREWAKAIHRRAEGHSTPALPGNPVAAWRWTQLRQEIVRRSELDEVALAARLKDCQANLRDATANLIDRKAWLGQKRRVGLKEQQALTGWAQLQRRIGKGTGKRAPALQAAARKLLVEAQGAVPVWIMPLSRVAEAVDPVNGRFDVVIIDEASQCEITGLLCWYLADQIVVVGDDKQVSPMGVGQNLTGVQALINTHLQDVPLSQLYDGQASLYDLAQQAFGGTIRLREHFRCMPDIIEFSNTLSYDFEIQPLRNPDSVTRPHVVEHVVEGASRDGKTNLREAQTIAATIGAIMERDEYAGKTLGAISLLGDEQAHLIWSLTNDVVEAKDLEDRRFLAGNSAQFQGDERHVMFLSIVDAPKDGPLAMRQEPYLKQRYNVAASRAQDQMWVVHSLNPGRDLKPGDLRRELIEYVRAPGARGAAAAKAARRAESPFELDVIKRLIAAGYGVEPQVKVGSYRIDMVVRGGGAQVALECDGARFHPPSQIPDDLARQAILERCGWRFVRIRSTAYFADPEKTMIKVFEQLRALGVEPDAWSGEVAEVVDDPLIEAVRRRAWEIMREKGWVEAVQLDLSEDQDDGLSLLM